MRCVPLITKKILGTHDMFILNALENFLYDFEITRSLKKAYDVRGSNSQLSEMFEKSQWVKFLPRQIFLRAVCSWFKVHCVLLIMEEVLGTNATFRNTLQNFLIDFEVTFLSVKFSAVHSFISTFSPRRDFWEKSMGRVFTAPNFSTCHTLLI